MRRMGWVWCSKSEIGGYGKVSKNFNGLVVLSRDNALLTAFEKYPRIGIALVLY